VNTLKHIAQTRAGAHRALRKSSARGLGVDQRDFAACELSLIPWYPTSTSSANPEVGIQGD
jgi:hypothetical protein